MALLEVDDIHTYYGNIAALKGISIEVEEGEIVTLIGSNGAGKSTTLRSISGPHPAAQGSVRFDGKEIAETAPQDIVRLGICTEGRYCFQRMTVRENPSSARISAVTHQRRPDRVFELFPRLQEREKQKAGTMSGGEQQMLAIGRALMANPKLLLLDEPSMGIAPILVERIYETISRSTARAPRSCWWSRTRTTRSACRSAATCRDGPGRSDKRGAARQPRGHVPGRMTVVIAVIGAKALYLLYAWLASAISPRTCRSEGLRVEGRPGRAPPERDRRRGLPALPGAAGLPLEAPGTVRLGRRQNGGRGTG